MEMRSHRVAKSLGEGVLVVVSILVAFALDAAWQESKERQDLHDDLANIRLELDENRARVEYHLDLAGRMVSALDVVLPQIAADDGPFLVPDTTVWLTTITPTLDASLGAVDALIASGRMAVIENADLARRLAGLRDRVEDAVEEQVQALEMNNVTVVPRMTGMDWAALQHIGDAMWSGARVPGTLLDYRGDVMHPSGPVIRNGLRVRRTLYFVALGELRGLLEEFDALEELIALEVGESG